MTIRKFISPRDLSGQLSLLEACAEHAPDGCYEHEKRVLSAIGDIATMILRQTRALGLIAPNCDQIREVEAVIYGYMREANPLDFAAAEGFGMAMDTPAKARVIAQATQSLRTLQRLGVVPPSQCDLWCGRLAVPGLSYCAECNTGMVELAAMLLPKESGT